MIPEERITTQGEAIGYKLDSIRRAQEQLAVEMKKLEISTCIAEVWPEAFAEGQARSPCKIRHENYQMPTLRLRLANGLDEEREFDVWALPKVYRDHCLERFLQENGNTSALRYRVDTYRKRVDKAEVEAQAEKENMATTKTKVRPCYIVCNTDGSTQQKRFRIHDNLAVAAVQAKGLAKAHPGDDFMIMEPIGGYRYTLDGDTMIELTVPKAEESEAIAPSTAV